MKHMKLIAVCLLLPALIYSADLLPQSKAWDFPKDIAAEQYAELNKYYEALYTKAEQGVPRREELGRMIGATIPLLPLKPTKTLLGDAGPYTVSTVEWPLTAIGNTPPTRGIVLNQVRFFGLLFEGKRGGPSIVLSPDPVDWNSGMKACRELARRGNTVILPIFVRRQALAQPYLDDRQWLLRLATQTGHHLLGAEALELSSAASYLRTLHPAKPLALIGIKDGSVAALLAGAIDEQFSSTWLLHPDKLPEPWNEPADKMIWKQYRGYGETSMRKLFKGRELHETLDAQELLTGEAEEDKPVQFDTASIIQMYNSHFVRWQAYFRNAALESYGVRKKAGIPTLEDYFDLTGRYDKPSGDFDGRSVQVYDTAEVSGYRLRLRVYEGVNAYGILLIPKKLDRAKKHPLVFVQHGLAGKPEDALGVEDNPKADDVYRKFGMQLARRGYVVFAPMISTQSGMERNELVRRSHPLGLTPVGIERVKFSRLLDYFSSLPFVDAERFGFYGLSYGGYTALWTTPGEPRFKAVVSSGHFNDWTAKTTDLTMGASYLYYADHMDMFNHGMLQKFSHADLAALIMPRPFGVEMGELDGVITAPRSGADAELDLVGARYRERGVGERFRVFRFDGPHRIDGPATFDFLDRWLK